MFDKFKIQNNEINVDNCKILQKVLFFKSKCK